MFDAGEDYDRQFRDIVCNFALKSDHPGTLADELATRMKECISGSVRVPQLNQV